MIYHKFFATFAMPITYLKPTTIKNKTVLLRVDVNVPLDKRTGVVADDFRIEQILPTIKLLQRGGNRIIICGHLGRPNGKPDPALSLRPVAKKMAQLLHENFVEHNHPWAGTGARHLVFYTGDIQKQPPSLEHAAAGSLVLLENLRFYPGEEENSAAFAKKLAALADVYVNDAFGVDHHASVSVSLVDTHLPSYAGLLLEKEIKSLDTVLRKHKKPFVLMMGGIKISDKVQAIKNLGEKADTILLGC